MYRSQKVLCFFRPSRRSTKRPVYLQIMNAPSRVHLEASIRPRTHATGAETPAMKPRKVNSEVRKQQNRIASRNYRMSCPTDDQITTSAVLTDLGVGEKRKRKLQQLQQLLDDDDPSESQTNTRSTSPYEDRSYSGSIGYERSVASSSPPITTVSGSFESPRPGQTTIVNQTWSTPIIPSAEQPLAYTYPQSVVYQPAVYSTGGPATTSYPVWNTISSRTNTGYTASDSAHAMTYSSYTAPWPSPANENFYAGSIHQQMAGPSGAPPATSWQHQTSEYFPNGIAVDPYGRRYFTYDPS